MGGGDSRPGNYESLPRPCAAWQPSQVYRPLGPLRTRIEALDLYEVSPFKPESHTALLLSKRVGASARARGHRF